MTRKISTRNLSRSRKRRRGAMIVLLGVLAVPLLAMVAFSVDYGFLLKTRTDLQGAADAAALAAVQDLIEVSEGDEYVSSAYVTVRNYATGNTEESFQVLDADIEVGEYDRNTIYSSSGVTLVASPDYYDTVRVTLRRDATANSPVSLFFAPVMGIQNSDINVTATAVLQKSTTLPPGAMILPIAVPFDDWEANEMGEEWDIYVGEQVMDIAGDEIPGNWGTVDVGPTNNSTSALRDQILNGLSQNDLDALFNDDVITQNDHIDSDVPAKMSTDTGNLAGLAPAVKEIHGETRLVPIYDYGISGTSSGENHKYHIVGWGVVTVVGSQLTGNDGYITVKKSYAYHGELPPQTDLSNTVGVIEGAFTSPALVE